MPLQLITAEETRARRKQRDAEYYARNKAKILAQKATYYAQNQQHILDKAHQYRAEHPEKLAAAKRKYLENHYEQMRASWARYAAENAEKKRAAAKQWRLTNPERAAAQRLAWARANPDKVNATNRSCYAKNPEAALIRWHNREARKRANGGVLSKDIVQQLLIKQNGLCACCGKPLGMKYHLDHIMPLVLGGANEDGNVQLLTDKCNLQKGAKHPEVFKKLQEGLCRSKN